MSIDYAKVMSEKSEASLQKYLDDTSKYVPEAIEAVIEELQKRGREFSEEELAVIYSAIEQRKLKINEEQQQLFGQNRGWKKNVVTDASAPLLYSENSIYLFGALFSVFFGATLLAMNVRSIKSSKGIFPIICFGIGYTLIQVWILFNHLPKANLTSIFCILGASVLNSFFWKKYIGKDIKYRAKPIWIPLTIGVITSALIIIAIVHDS